MAARIGELLIKEKRITVAQLQEALVYQKVHGGRLGLNLVRLGFIKDEEILGILSQIYGVASINLARYEIAADVLRLIRGETANRYQIVPLTKRGTTLTIATTDPGNQYALDDLKFLTGFDVEPILASDAAMADAIAKYYPPSAPQAF